MKNLTHGVSFHCREKTAPSKPGIKQLDFAQAAPKNVTERLEQIAQQRALLGYDQHFRRHARHQVDIGAQFRQLGAIESLNAKLRQAVRTRGHFPTDESALKLLFLVLNRAAKEWKMPPREWSMAKAQFAILFEERFSLA